MQRLQMGSATCICKMMCQFFMVCWQLMSSCFRKMSDSNDVVVPTVFHDRTSNASSQFHKTFNYFINMLPAIAQVEVEDTITSFLGAVETSVVHAIKHAGCPFT